MSIPVRRALIVMAALLPLSGCGEPKNTINVQVNRVADHSAVNSIAVLEFDWTPPGTRPRSAVPATPPPPPASRPDAGKEQPKPHKAASTDEQAEGPRDKDGDDEDKDADDEEKDADDEDKDSDDEDKDSDDEDDYDDDTPEYIRRAGSTIADQMTTGLLGLGRYSVCERTRLKALLDEADLSAIGIVRGHQYGQATQLLGVDALVIGEVKKYSEGLSSEISFSCRCVNRQGVLLWSMEGQSDAMSIRSTPLQWTTDLIRQMIEDLDVKLADVEGRAPLISRPVPVDTTPPTGRPN